MNPLKFSVTMLESFRLYRDAGFMDESDIIATVKRETEQTHAMALGEAVHSIMEHPPEHTGVVERLGYQFDMGSFDGVMNDCRPDDWEHEVTVSMQTDDGHTVTGRVDVIGGLVLFDYKVTENPIRLEKYHDSYQWRLYLAMTGCWRFDYVPIRVAADENGIYRVADYCRLSFYEYSGMEKDCDRLIQEFVTWVRRRGLDRYLENRQDPERGAPASNRAEPAGKNVAA